MPNQINYVQSIPTNPQMFSVSRLAESDTDTDIIVGRLPGKFGFASGDNIEMHFYDSTNSLAGSVIIPVSSKIITGKTITLPDGTIDEKVIVDMTRVQKELGLIIPPGNYTVSINLFSDEIGSYINPKMIIEEVSPSRSELRLGFTTNFTQTEESELFEFIQPSVPRVLAAGLLGGTVGVGQGDTITQNETGDFQVQTFISKVVETLLVANPTLLDELINLEPDAPDNLNLTIEFLTATIYDEFVALLAITKETKQFNRLQDEEIKVLLERAVDNALSKTNINLFTQNVIRYDNTPEPNI